MDAFLHVLSRCHMTCIITMAMICDPLLGVCTAASLLVLLLLIIIIMCLLCAKRRVRIVLK